MPVPNTCKHCGDYAADDKLCDACVKKQAESQPSLL